MAAATGDIPVEIRHPLPVLRPVRGRDGARLAVVDVTTPVVLRAVPPGCMAPVAFPLGDGELDGHAHDGRFWRELFHAGDGRGRAPVPIAEAVAALRGDASARPSGTWGYAEGLGRRGYPGSPLTAHEPPGTISPPTRRWKPALVEAAPGLEADVRARVLAFFERDVVHDGAHVYVAHPVPVVHGSYWRAAPSDGVARLAARPSALKIHGPSLRLDRPGEADAFRAAQNRRPDGSAHRVRDLCLPVLERAGIGCDDADVDAFLDQAPALLAQVAGVAADRAVLGGPPGFREGLAGRVADLRPWVARGLVGAVAEADRASLAARVHGLARDMMEAHYPRGTDHRPAGGAGVYLRWLVRFVEIVAAPRLSARSPGPDGGDARALAALAVP